MNFLNQLNTKLHHQYFKVEDLTSLNQLKIKIKIKIVFKIN